MSQIKECHKRCDKCGKGQAKVKSFWRVKANESPCAKVYCIKCLPTLCNCGSWPTYTKEDKKYPQLPYPPSIRYEHDTRYPDFKTFEKATEEHTYCQTCLLIHCMGAKNYGGFSSPFIPYYTRYAGIILVGCPRKGQNRCLLCFRNHVQDTKICGTCNGYIHNSRASRRLQRETFGKNMTLYIFYKLCLSPSLEFEQKVIFDTEVDYLKLQHMCCDNIVLDKKKIDQKVSSWKTDMVMIMKINNKTILVLIELDGGFHTGAEYNDDVQKSLFFIYLAMQLGLKYVYSFRFRHNITDDSMFIEFMAKCIDNVFFIIHSSISLNYCFYHGIFSSVAENTSDNRYVHKWKESTPMTIHEQRPVNERDVCSFLLGEKDLDEEDLRFKLPTDIQHTNEFYLDNGMMTKLDKSKFQFPHWLDLDYRDILFTMFVKEMQDRSIGKPYLSGHIHGFGRGEIYYLSSIDISQIESQTVEQEEFKTDVENVEAVVEEVVFTEYQYAWGNNEEEVIGKKKTALSYLFRNIKNSLSDDQWDNVCGAIQNIIADNQPDTVIHITKQSLNIPDDVQFSDRLFTFTRSRKRTRSDR